MEKSTPVPLHIDQVIAAKLIEMADDESHVSQYLAELLQYAEQQDLGQGVLVEPIRAINELLDKQNEYQSEVYALNKCLHQVMADNQELLATLQL